MDDDKDQVGFLCLVPCSQREQFYTDYTCTYICYLIIQIICMLWKQKGLFGAVIDICSCMT